MDCTTKVGFEVVTVEFEDEYLTYLPHNFKSLSKVAQIGAIKIMLKRGENEDGDPHSVCLTEPVDIPSNNAVSHKIKAYLQRWNQFLLDAGEYRNQCYLHILRRHGKYHMEIQNMVLPEVESIQLNREELIQGLRLYLDAPYFLDGNGHKIN